MKKSEREEGSTKNGKKPMNMATVCASEMENKRSAAAAATTMKVRSKQEEYRQIADLTGFDNLKSLMEAEALMMARKKERKKMVMMNKNSNNYMKKNKLFRLQVQKVVLADKGEASKGKDGAVEAKEVLKTEAVEGLKRDLFQTTKSETFHKLIVDAATGTEQVDKTSETTGTLLADDGIKSSIAFDLTLPSLEGCGKGMEVVSMESFTKMDIVKGKSGMNEKVHGDYEENWGNAHEAMGIESFELTENVVLRQLLRKPRYFDAPQSYWCSCLRCGEEGHRTGKCTMQKGKKPCFICGSFLHIAKRCKQNRKCSICRRRGHLASYCPGKDQESDSNRDICYRCGNSGHVMFSCTNDYSPDDLKDIRCYVCKNFGHLCCVDFPDTCPRELSCYSCGQSGHLGSECTNKNCFKDAEGGTEQSHIQNSSGIQMRKRVAIS